MFTETQRFRQPWLLAVLAICAGGVIPLVWGLYQQLVLDYPYGTRPMSDNALILTTSMCIAIMGSLLWLFAAMYLRVEVRADGLFIRFFPFLKRSIPYANIKAAEARTYNPIGEYGGWGLRYGRNGKAYNVSGTCGVQLTLVSGERLLLGSQRADELAAAVQAQMHH